MFSVSGGPARLPPLESPPRFPESMMGGGQPKRTNPETIISVPEGGDSGPREGGGGLISVPGDHGREERAGPTPAKGKRK